MAVESIIDEAYELVFDSLSEHRILDENDVRHVLFEKYENNKTIDSILEKLKVHPGFKRLYSEGVDPQSAKVWETYWTIYPYLSPFPRQKGHISMGGHITKG